jgi:hypothetical protein
MSNHRISIPNIPNQLNEENAKIIDTTAETEKQGSVSKAQNHMEIESAKGTDIILKLCETKPSENASSQGDNILYMNDISTENNNKTTENHISTPQNKNQNPKQSDKQGVLRLEREVSSKIIKREEKIEEAEEYKEMELSNLEEKPEEWSNNIFKHVTSYNGDNHKLVKFFYENYSDLNLKTLQIISFFQLFEEKNPLLFDESKNPFIPNPSFPSAINLTEKQETQKYKKLHEIGLRERIDILHFLCQYHFLLICFRFYFIDLKLILKRKSILTVSEKMWSRINRNQYALVCLFFS